MPKALSTHVDHLLIIGLENDANVHFQHIIAAYQHPATATGQHRSLEFRPFEYTGAKPCDAPPAIGGVSEREDGNVEGDREQKLGFDFSHELSPVESIGALEVCGPEAS